MNTRTDPTRRTPGQYARATVQRLRMRTLVWLGALAVATALVGRTFGLNDLRFAAAEIVLLASMFVVSRYVLPLVERRDRGAAGEEYVGALLESLRGDGWRVIHDASFGRGNIDHILVGPAGVFTIETKSHPGPVRSGAVHGSTIAQARAQSRGLERATGVASEPLLVFSRAWVDRPGARRRGVTLLPAKMLPGFLLRREERLSEQQVRETHATIARTLRERAADERRVLDFRLPHALR